MSSFTSPMVSPWRAIKCMIDICHLFSLHKDIFISLFQTIFAKDTIWFYVLRILKGIIQNENSNCFVEFFEEKSSKFWNMHWNEWKIVDHIFFLSVFLLFLHFILFILNFVFEKVGIGKEFWIRSFFFIAISAYMILMTMPFSVI